MVLDMQMPGMDGLQLARAIKAQPKLASIPMIMLTSAGLRGHAGESRKAGIAGYLTKPVRQSQLYDCLATVVSTGRQSAPATPWRPAPLVTRHSLKEARAHGRHRVLVADDNETNQMVAARMLGKLGYRADVAANGREAVEALARIAYDLVLMDCQMPEMDGFEATRAIRQAEAGRGRRTPIVAITANALRGDRESCLEAGMDDYLPKPVDLEALCACVTHWLKAAAGAAPEAAPDGAAAAKPSASAPTPAPAPVGAKPVAPVVAKTVTPQRPARPAEPPRKSRIKVVEVGDEEELAFGHVAEGSGEGAELPTLDLERLEEMCMGVAKLRDQLLDTFLAEIGPRLDRLAEAVSLGDAHQVEVEAHGLRGMLGTIGARAGAELFSALETLSIAGDVAAAGPLLKRATIEAGRTRAAIEALPFRHAA
jgi:CheY-like chemotaxis protein